ncbi:MAG: hypothetical protein IT289_01385 [Oligoflexia bacterium]|nr:hypothetical protein [Oligoflexia bacterium]
MKNKVRIKYLTSKGWDKRWVALKKMLVEAGVDFEVETLISPAEEFEKNLNQVRTEDLDAIGFGYEYYSLVPKLLAQTTQEAIKAGVCSCLIKEKGGWWPRDCISEAFVRAISHEVKELDLNSRAFVAGAGGLGRLVAEALVKLGFKGITLTDQNEEKGRELLANLQKSLFQVDFRFIEHRHITTLAGVHSIAVNTTELVLENELLDELYFFNFLKAGGVVVDMTLVPTETPLIDEAKVWGARFLSGDCVTAYLDAFMVEKLCDFKLDIGRYREALKALADQESFDKTPFLKRFRDRGG